MMPNPHYNNGRSEGSGNSNPYPWDPCSYTGYLTMQNQHHYQNDYQCAPDAQVGGSYGYAGWGPELNGTPTYPSCISSMAPAVNGQVRSFNNEGRFSAQGSAPLKPYLAVPYGFGGNYVDYLASCNRNRDPAIPPVHYDQYPVQCNQPLPTSSESMTKAPSLQAAPDVYYPQSQPESRNKRAGDSKGRRVQKKNKTIIPRSIHIVERVFIWDLDETIIIFNSLLNGTYAEKHQKNVEYAKELGHSMERLINELLDRKFFYKDLEQCDQVNIYSTPIVTQSPPDLSKRIFSSDELEMRYYMVKKTYNEHRHSLEGLLDPPSIINWKRMLEEINELTDHWNGLVKECFDRLIARNNCLNILVTSCQLVPALVKLLLFDIGNLFSVEDVYSASKIGKQRCFELIQLRFNSCNYTYVAVGDGQEEETAAHQLKIPFWKVSNHHDLVMMRQALELEYL